LADNAAIPNPALLAPVVFAAKELIPKPALAAPEVFTLNTLEPKAALLAPVFEPAKALLPTTVLVDIAPAPLPTVRPDIEASLVVVIVVNDGEPPDTAKVPDVLGRVSVVVTASVGVSVVEPDVAPFSTNGMVFP
jgi:hypothetical protein